MLGHRLGHPQVLGGGPGGKSLSSRRDNRRDAMQGPARPSHTPGEPRASFPPPGGKVATLEGFGQPLIRSLLFQGGARGGPSQGHLSGDVRDSSESPSWSKPSKGTEQDANRIPGSIPTNHHPPGPALTRSLVDLPPPLRARTQDRCQSVRRRALPLLSKCSGRWDSQPREDLLSWDSWEWAGSSMAGPVETKTPSLFPARAPKRGEGGWQGRMEPGLWLRRSGRASLVFWEARA